ncbi:MAG: hypothetical protein IJE66_08370, partial [Akkermansia sp.]|nr:hypothetical protein [Akkermansia sp.]
ALVETICAQRSELFIRKSPATAKPSAETGHSSIVLPYNFPYILCKPVESFTERYTSVMIIVI